MQVSGSTNFTKLDIRLLEYIYSESVRKIDILLEDLTILYQSFNVGQNYG